VSLRVADVFVSVGADLRAYQADLKKAEGLAEPLGQSIRTALTKALGTSNLGGGGFVNALKSALGDVVGTARNGLSSLEGVGTRVLGGLRNLAGTVFKGFLLGVGIQSFLDLQQVFSRLTQVIPDLIAKGQAYAVNVEDISLRTGASAKASSGLAATLTFLGIPIDGVGTKLSAMAKQVYTNEKNFAALGIATRGAHNEFLSGVAILDNIRQRYQTLGPGIERAAIAQQLISRGGGELLQYLSLSDKQVSSLTVEWGKLGLVLDEAGVQRAKDVQREQALLGLALTGLGERLFQVVAPAIMAVTDAFVNLVANKGPEIEAFFGRLAGYIMGVMQALTGIDMSASNTFLSKLDLSKNLISDQAAAQTTAAAATKAATSALTAETAALDRQAAALTKTAAAEETVFQRKLHNLSATVAAQLSAMDAEQAAADTAKQRAQFTRDLADAQRALTDAELNAGGVKPGDAAGARSAAEAVASAEQKIADLRQQRADFEKSLLTDARRAQLTATQKYVDDVASLEASTADKKSLAHTMATREQALVTKLAADKAKGDTQAVADDEIRLQAVRTAKARSESGARISTAQSEITAKKAAISAETTALSTIPPVIQAITKAYQGTKAGAIDAAGAVTGKGGLVSAMNDGMKAGIDAGNGIKNAFAGLTDILLGSAGISDRGEKVPGARTGGLLGALGSIADLFVAAAAAAIEFGKQLGLLDRGTLTIVAGVVGALTKNPALLALALGSAVTAPETNRFTPLEDLLHSLLGGNSILGVQYAPAVPGHATGLWNSPTDHLAFIHRREMVLPPSVADAARSFGAPQFAAAGGSLVIENHLYLGGRGSREITDWIDESLAHRRVRRT
jgi:hypothetical protein